jgi:hypothetical protein
MFLPHSCRGILRLNTPNRRDAFIYKHLKQDHTMSPQSMKSRLGSLLYSGLTALRWSPYRLTCPKIRTALEHLTPEQLVYAVNISRHHHYVYMDNPKTGCSSLKSALVQLELQGINQGLNHYDWQVFHDPAVSPLTRLNDLKRPTSLTALGAEGYRFITMVRNPYTRFLSCYRDKILKNRPQKLEILKVLGRHDSPLEADISFAEFAEAVASQADLDMNPHWRVQSAHILYGIVDYTYIGRFEQYDQDFRECFRVLGIPESDIPETRHLNRTKSGDEENCRHYFTQALQDLIYRRYRQDFENFGYAYELPEH